MASDLIKKLTLFGFTKNEAKAYISLLEKQPATGYEISQLSGVPRSAIYDLLRKLETRGVIYAEGKSPVYYHPISTDQLSTQLKSSFEHNIHELRAGLSQLNVPKSGDNTWNIKGYATLVDQARSLIDSARQSIFFSVWGREYDELRNQLSQAKKRGVEMCCFSFTGINNAIGNLYSYDIDEEKLREIWHRQIVMISDKKTAILGGADNTMENQGIYTENPAIVDTCLNYLILDLTLFSHRKKINVHTDLEKMMSTKTDKLSSLLQ